MIFLRKAQNANKPTLGMEFWYEPFKVLDSLPEPEQVYYLFGASAANRNRVRYIGEIFADWKTGNTADLEFLSYSGLPPDDKVVSQFEWPNPTSPSPLPLPSRERGKYPQKPSPLGGEGRVRGVWDFC